MKKKLILAITALLMFATPFLPSIVVASLDSYDTQIIEYSYFSKSVKATGEIKTNSGIQLILDYPLVFEEVYVSVGDDIIQGQAVAKVDKELTIETIFSAVTSQALPSIVDEVSYSQLISQLEYLPAFENLIDTDAIPQYIYAGSPGRIAAVNISKNSLTMPNTPLIEYGYESTAIVSVKIDEEYLSQIDIGDTAVIIPVTTGEKLYGKVSFISKVAFSAVDNFVSEKKVEINITLDDSVFVIDSSSVEVEIFSVLNEMSPTIPFNAVLQDEDGTEFVYILNGTTPEKRYVTLGLSSNLGYQLYNGVSAGERVILNPPEDIEIDDIVITS